MPEIVGPTDALGMQQFRRMLGLFNAANKQIRDDFLRLIGSARGVRTLEEISRLLDLGLVEQALDVMDEVTPAFANAIEAAYTAAGVSTAAYIRRQTRSLVTFDLTNARSVAALRGERLRLVQQLTEQQRLATLTAIQDGVGRGLSPKQLARTLRSSLGLTQHQMAAVTRFRALLSEGNLHEALTRELRDKRFDRILRRQEPLTPAQIDRMVSRFQDRAIIHRSKVIAQTEAARAINMADQEMWQQAIDAGVVSEETILHQWFARFHNTRSHHASMNRQVRAHGAPFTSGLGNSLRFPADPNAPARDVVGCNCVRATLIPEQDSRVLAAA